MVNLCAEYLENQVIGALGINYYFFFQSDFFGSLKGDNLSTVFIVNDVKMAK